MNRIYVPATNLEDWQALLAEPEKHWRTGYSAKALAQCWMEADGFPASVREAFSNSGIKMLEDVEMLVAIPEHKVPLPGGGHPSQNDLFILAKGGGELITIMVEGKVSEPFGPTVGEWLVGASEGKRRRLEYLQETLGLPAPLPSTIRYQLLHRTASAIIEAKRFNAPNAMMLVHSFSKEAEWFEDYAAFASLLGIKPSVGGVHLAKEVDGMTLYLAWVTGEGKSLSG